MELGFDKGQLETWLCFSRSDFGNVGCVRDAVLPLAAAAFRHTALLNCPETPVKVAHVYFEMLEFYAIYSHLRFDVQFDVDYMLHCCYIS